MDYSALSRRVLVVDDNVDSADLIAEFVALNGHAATVAYGGLEAIAAARSFRPDIIFLDLDMPIKSGFEVAAELRRSPALAGTRIVALTGWGSDEFRDRVSSGGFDDQMTKPVRLEELLTQVGHCRARLAA